MPHPLLILALLVPNAAAGGPVDRTVVAHVIAKEPLADGGWRVVVDRGRRDGIANDAAIERLGRGRAVLRLDDDPGAAVPLHAKVAEPATLTVGFELAVQGVVVTDARGRPLNRWRRYARDPDALSDAVVCEQLAASVRSHAEAADPAWIPRPAKRFRDRPLGEVLATASAEDACGALHWLARSDPAPGEVDAVASFVDWAARGGPMAPTELWVRSPALDDDAFAQLAIRHGGDANFAATFYVLSWDEAERSGDAGRALAPTDRLVAATLDPTAAWYAAWARGRIQRRLGDAEGAFATWSAVLAHAPPGLRTGALADFGLVAMNTGRDALAVRVFETAIAEGGTSPDLWQQYGSALANMERYDEALPILEKAVEAQLKSPAKLHDAGLGLTMIYRCQESLGRVDDAITTLDRLERIATDHGFPVLLAASYSGRAEQALAREEFAAAGEWFERAARTRPDNGLDLLRAGEAFWDAGEQARGYALVDEATDALAGERPEALAQAFRALGDMEDELGDVSSAIALWREALRVLDDRPPSWTKASLWDEIARAEAARDRLEPARAAFAEARAIGRALEDPFIEAGALTGLGFLGDDDPEALRAAADVWIGIGYPGMAASLVNYLATLDGANREALANEALALLDAERPALKGSDLQRNIDTVALVHNTRAEIAWTRGQQDEAYAILEQALALGPTRSDDVTGAQSTFDLRLGHAERALARARGEPIDALAEASRARVAVAANLQLGRLDDALAAAHRNRRLASDALGESAAYQLLAQVHFLRGEIGEADRAARRARALGDRALPPALASSTWVVQGEIAFALGDPERAIRLAEEALATGPDTPTVIGALRLRARARAAAADVSGAREDLVRAGALARAEVGPVEEAGVALQRAELELDAGEPGAAREWLARTTAGAGDALLVASAELIGARIDAQTDAAAARVAFERVAARAEAMGAAGLRADALLELAGLLAESEPQGAVAALTDVVGIRDRQHAALDLEIAIALRAADPTWDDLAALLRAQGRGAEAAVLLAERRRAPEVEVAAIAADLPLQDRLLRLGEQVPDLPERMAVPMDALLAVQATLAPDEAVVEPIVLPDRVLLLVARGGRPAPTYHELPVAESVVHARVEAVRRALDAPGEGWGTTSRGVKTITTREAKVDPTQAARELHDLLVAPLAGDLEGVETLVFAPGGRLRYVPFAALTDGERFLVERYRVALLSPSGATRESRPIRRDGRLVALSNPDGSLPAATDEAAAVRRAWGKARATVHDGAAATEEALRSEVRGASILHLATHGHLRNDDPRASWLLLAGPEGEARLTVPEIAVLPLGSVDLAVLSACETAVGDGGEGQEIAGLAYQFENRGVASIVASLWPVDDAATGELMIRLYRELRRDGTTRADALREAQLELIADPERRHPYYWAAFVLIGDWR